MPMSLTFESHFLPVVRGGRVEAVVEVAVLRVVPALSFFAYST